MISHACSSLSLTERSSVLRSRIGLWEKYYYAQFDIMHVFSSDVGVTYIVVRSTRQSGVEMKYGVPTMRGQWLAPVNGIFTLCGLG